MTFRIDLEDLECLGLRRSIFLLCGLTFESLFPRVLNDPTSTRLLTELRKALLASEGTSSDFEWDMENDISRGGVRTECKEGDFDVNPLSLSFSSIWDNWTVSAGLVAMVGLTSTTKTETEGDGVFQESWLYMLADVIALDFTERAVRAAHPDKVYSVEDSSVLDNLQKEWENKLKIKYHTIKRPENLNLPLHKSSS